MIQKLRNPEPVSVRRRLAAIVCALLLCAGCTRLTIPERLTRENALVRLAPREYPVFSDDLGYDGLAYGLRQSLAYLQRLPADQVMVYGADAYPVSHVRKSLEHFLDYLSSRPDSKQLNSHIKRYYRVYSAVGRRHPGEVLFTGYYEPILQGCRHPTEVCHQPVFTVPDDLIDIDLSLFSPRYENEHIRGRYTGRTVVPYFDRRAIDTEGVLDGRASVIAWVKDPVDLFFLQIQGSGRIYLDEGGSINVHYANANGRPYRSIGKILIDRGDIPRDAMSMQAIRQWVDEHPDQMEALFFENPSYVFFETVDDGPLGALNVKLTPGRSAAMDLRLFPKGALAFAVARKPLVDGEGRIEQWVPMKRFTLIQDTGGAIRGAGRVDLFWGNGPYAEIAAGHLQHTGRLFVLVLDPDHA